MNRRFLAILAILALSWGLLPIRAVAQTKLNRAPPFEGVRWVPEVKIDGRWYQLRSIDGVPVQKVVEFMLSLDDEKMTKRFAEDLVEILTKMGRPPGATVKLVVRDVETGKEQTLAKVPLTQANRDAIRKLKLDQVAPRPLELKRETLHGALDDFKVALDERWSYRRANRADFDAAIGVLRKKIEAGISTEEFGVELQKIIALGIDGHAGVSGYRRRPRGGFLPFRVAAEGERVVAFDRDRKGFLLDGFPYLTKINGKDIADWCSAAAVLAPKSSPQYVRYRCLRHVEEFDPLREMMKLPSKTTIEVELASADGKARKTLTLPVGQSPNLNDRWPAGDSRVLDGSIGYLRLVTMNETFSVPEIKKWMPKFKNTAGLIIDVRDNSGGHRDALLLLYSYLAGPDDPPRVFTAAAYRLHRAHKEDHLVKRFMYRADAKEWTAKERAAVSAFAKSFRPEWELPKGQFSDWHYLALSRLDDKDIYHYSKPVVVLMNARCFSATDVFLAGLKGMKKVTLLGVPSGGGSALAQVVLLGATPFSVRIGSMASFQADGKLFDGNGVRPDVVVAPVPEYHIGGRDNVLEAAVKRIEKR